MKKSAFLLLSVVISGLLLYAETLFALNKNASKITPGTADTTIDKVSSTMYDGVPKTFLALGDSYTIGQSVDSAERFPAQAAALLQKHGIYIPSIQYIATTGWKTVNLAFAIEDQRKTAVYDVVTLLIGVNDQHFIQDTNNYRNRFTILLEKAIAFAGGRKDRVFVLSIPDYSVTPFGEHNMSTRKQIDEFNAINKNVTLGYGITYTDITGISRYDAIDTSMLAFDDLHPSGKQYAQWAQLLTKKMLQVFE